MQASAVLALREGMRAERGLCGWVCRKTHKFLLSTKYEFAASRVTTKLISDTACGFAAAHNPPHLHRDRVNTTIYNSV